MTTIYVVTQGHYSDYGIVAVCSTEENAQLYVDSLNDASIEEYELDELSDLIKQGYKSFYIKMFRDGTTEDIYNYMGLPMQEDTISLYKAAHYVPCLLGYVTAKSKEHAVKIANEKRAMLIASGEWE